jgi:hypothetical protein
MEPASRAEVGRVGETLVMSLTALSIGVPLVVGTIAALLHAGDDDWQS